MASAEAQSHGQFGEDRALREIFGERTDGCCVEIGAYDGRTGSATYLFEKRGWRCLLVEPNPALVEQIREHRACSVVNCAVSDKEGMASFFVAENVEEMSTLDLTPDRLEWITEVGGAVKEITVRTATLDSLLAEAGFPEIQFITIDVEGHEMDVLKGFTLEKHRPRIVIIEDNAASDDPRARGGDPRVGGHMAAHGYVHFRRTGVNEWYAHESDKELVRPDEIRRFRRAKARQRWRRRGVLLSNRIATRAGAHLPTPLKQRLRAPFDYLRSKGSRASKGSQG
ncbi:MAG: FkbM family methyltransferase [Solirubrobacteraceae bacterium]